MVGGAGYMAGKSAANRAGREAGQEERLSGLESAQAPPPPPPPPSAPAAGPSTIEQLTQLGELRDKGVLTAEEFEREKQKVLAG
jgi:putative oligomerization/nucleic acid binding protein